MDGQDDLVQSDAAQGRRAFLKRMAALAFAAPVISSFVLDSDAFAGGRDQHGKNRPNQYGQNQTGQEPPPNQYGYNQTGQEPPPNQYGQNQTQQPCDPPNQHGPDKGRDNKPPRRK
jgi:hypothetical protein